MGKRRVIILDTETTGVNPEAGDRIVEVACLEMVDFEPTGAVFHSYFDPQVSISEDVSKIIGISNEMLAGKPIFAQKADEFLAFIGEALLVCHGADFDRRFLTAELRTCGKPVIPDGRYVDTVKMARHLFPGKPASLIPLYNRLFPWDQLNDLRGTQDHVKILSIIFPVLVRYSFDRHYDPSFPAESYSPRQVTLYGNGYPPPLGRPRPPSRNAVRLTQ